MKTIPSIVVALTLMSCNMSFGKPSVDKFEEEGLELKGNSQNSQTQVYECYSRTQATPDELTQGTRPDDYEFSVRWLNTDEVTLYLDRGTVTLERVRSASGAKYQNQDVMFWNKADFSLLEIEGEVYNCERNALRESRDN